MKEENNEVVAIWSMVGLFVCMFLIATVANHFDFAINGARLFSVDENPLVDIEEIDITYRDEVKNSMQSLEDTWGNSEAFIDTNFGNIKLPNVANVGVLFAMCLYCLSWIFWVKIGEKFILPKLKPYNDR